MLSEILSQPQDEWFEKDHLAKNERISKPKSSTSAALIKDGWHVESGHVTTNEHTSPPPGACSKTSLECPQSSWSKQNASLMSDTPWRNLLPSRSTPPAKARWPNPELSIGVPCAPLGRNKCWEVTGPAREISSALFRIVKDILDQHSEYLHETECVPFSIMFGLYMIGRNEQKASPTLVLSCEPKKPRQKALKVIRETSILQSYPGILLAESSRSPAIAGLVRPLGALGAADGEIIYFTPPTQNNVCGLPIHVMEGFKAENVDSTTMSQKATIGGFIRLTNSENYNLYCGLTVAHAFEDEIQLDPPSGDIEFSFDEENDESSPESDSEIAPRTGV